MNTNQLLENYIENSIKNKNFNHFDFSKELTFDLKTPTLYSFGENKNTTIQEERNYTENIRNVFTNFDLLAKNNTQNQFIAEYGITHLEPHSKPVKGKDIVF